ncbi:MAG: hypothetical protein L0Z68_04120 [Gammaproteobacteria bacterium]|nr:hypothetical protein [Gammaproteobacteria bacterium]
MELPYRSVFLKAIIFAVLLTTPYNRIETLTALEATVLAGNWQVVDSLVAIWTYPAEFQREAAVLRGYAGLARGDAGVAVRHFLRARLGRRDHGEPYWAETLATRFPNNPFAQFLAGDALIRGGDRRAGLKRLDAALALDPDLALARTARAMVSMISGQRQAALDDLNVLVKDGQVTAEALAIRGLLHLKDGQSETALADLNRALEVSPEHAVAYNARGVVYGRLGDWVSAARDFKTAFLRAPELVEARHNWQLAEAASERGAVLSAKQNVGSITMVVADKANMHTATAFASDATRARMGQSPLVATNVGEAIALSRSHNVILQVPNGGLGAVGGDRVLNTLNTISGATSGKVSVDIVTDGFGAADNTTLGALRYLNAAPQTSQTRLTSLQMVNSSEASGLAGRTFLATTDTGTVARRAGEIQGRGVPVVAFPTEGKFGVQHMGNVKAFQEHNIPTYSAQWQGKGEIGLGLSARPPFVGPSLGVSNAADSAGSRTSLAPRDWIFRGNGTERYVTGTLPELLKQQMGSGPSAATELATQRLQPAVTAGGAVLTPGGISVGPVYLMRGTGGRIVFKTADGDGEELALVYTLFRGD